MNCKNCNTHLSENNNYCPNCGGKVIRNRLTLKLLLAHFSEQFLNYDNKLLQTFIHLFTKPEIVIGGYINGTRKKYVDVVSFFALTLTVSGLQIFILNKFYPELMDFSSMKINRQETSMKNFMDTLNDYNSIIMMLLIPVYALISKIVFFNKKKFNYTEHIVIYMYIIAQTTIINTFFILFPAILGIKSLIVVSIVSIPLSILYTSYCLKRLYELSLKQIILKILFFLLILLIFYFASILIGLIFFIILNPEIIKNLIGS